MALIITKENFEAEVINSEIPVLVDFWAAWCGPCKMIGPVIDDLATDLEGQVKVGKINVDEQSDLAAKFNVMSIPTLLVFKGGEIAGTAVGVRSKEEIKELLEL